MTPVEERATPEETVDWSAAEDRGATDKRIADPAMYLLVVVIQLIVIWPIKTKRAFDGDESMYAMAAKLVAHGHQPYFDFWFQYPPGLPYLYGGWTRLTGESIQNLRTLSALLTVTLGVILYAHVAHRFSRRLGLAAVIMFITSALVFNWYSTYKHYAASTLFMFVAYVVVAAADRDEPCGGRRWFAAGVFFGLSVDVRLFFIAVLPVFAYYALVRHGPFRNRFARYPALIGGLAIGLLPSIYFFARDPARFVSDALLSQTNRSHLSLLNSVIQKLRTAGLLLGTAQFLILVAAAVALVALVFMTRRRVPFAIAIAAALGLVSLLPTPTFDQYFSTLVPFLVIGVVELWRTILATVPHRTDRRLAVVVRTMGIAGLLAFVLAGAGAFDNTLHSGQFLLDPPHERLVSEAIDAHTRVGEVVIDFSPFDLYESHAVPLSGLESNFGTLIAADLKMSDNAAARYKLLTINRLEAIVQSRRIRTIVIAPGDSLLFPRPWTQILTELGYRPVETVSGRTIYQLPQE
jgi:4-amino-4-deoxy-L-arabinose transferase-like glycosyltransferase